MFSRAAGISHVERQRRCRGLTATELAARMGVSRSWLSQVERGWLAPSETFKSKAAAALGTAIAELFPEFIFLTTREQTGLRLLGLGERTLAFSSERQARAAITGLSAATQGSGIVWRGPAALDFFATAHGVLQEETLGRLLVDPPEIDPLLRQITSDQEPFSKRRSVATSRRSEHGAA